MKKAGRLYGVAVAIAVLMASVFTSVVSNAENSDEKATRRMGTLKIG